MRKRPEVSTKIDAPPPIMHPGAAERALVDLQRVISQNKVSSEAELEALLNEQMKGGIVGRVAPGAPLEEAQDLVFEAWEATGKRRLALARKAIAISEDCADAYSLLAEEDAQSWQDALALWHKAVAAGERAMGRDWRTEFEGAMWGALETRPYMRARLGLAMALWQLGQINEAADHMEDMLALNPNDNQGVRSVLATLYRNTGRFEQLSSLIERYADGPETWSLYDRALVLYAAEGASPEANAALDRALHGNPHVQEHIASPVREDDVPDYIDVGGPLDALAYCAEAGEVWRRYDGALMWLIERPAPRKHARQGARRSRPR